MERPATHQAAAWSNFQLDRLNQYTPAPQASRTCPENTRYSESRSTVQPSRRCRRQIALDRAAHFLQLWREPLNAFVASGSDFHVLNIAHPTSMSSESFAQMFERVLVPSIFRQWAEDLLERAQPLPRERALDVGCGTGIVARLLRERCGPAASITGVDLNPDMIAVARRLAPHITWQQANAVELPFATASFDLVLSQQAVQFFPDRAAGLREMRRVLAGGGRIALSTWRPIEENPLYLTLHQLANEQFGPNADRRFSFGDPDAIHRLLVGAGFRNIEIQTVTHHDRIADPDTFVAMNLGATTDLDLMDEATRRPAVAAFLAEARKRVSSYFQGETLVHPVSANVAIATT